MKEQRRTAREEREDSQSATVAMAPLDKWMGKFFKVARVVFEGAAPWTAHRRSHPGAWPVAAK